MHTVENQAAPSYSLIVSTAVTLPGLPRSTQNHWNTVTVQPTAQIAILNAVDAPANA